MFELTVCFNIGEIGIWQRFDKKFELYKQKFDLTVFKLGVSNL